MSVPDSYIAQYLATKGVLTFDHSKLVVVSSQGDTITYLYDNTYQFKVRIIQDPTSSQTYTYVFFAL